MTEVLAAAGLAGLAVAVALAVCFLPPLMFRQGYEEKVLGLVLDLDQAMINGDLPIDPILMGLRDSMASLMEHSKHVTPALIVAVGRRSAATDPAYLEWRDREELFEAKLDKRQRDRVAEIRRRFFYETMWLATWNTPVWPIIRIIASRPRKDPDSAVTYEAIRRVQEPVNA